MFRRSGFLPLPLIICAAGAAWAAPEDSPFLDPVPIDVPQKMVYDIGAGDFDGLNGPDLALVSYFGDHLVIMLNEGLGHFAEPVTYPAGDGTISLVCADLTGDGLLDIATIGRRDDTLRLFRGQGNGTFVASATWPTGDEPIELVVAELDGQPGRDLACTNLGGLDPTFSVFINNGAGDFTPTNYATAAGQRGISAADLTGDGRDDLVMTLYGAGQVAVHLNDGAGHFGPAVTLTTVEKPYSICARDLDGNSTVDIILTHKDENNQIWAIPGLGNGQFGIPLTWDAPEIMDCLLLADLDADSDDDLLVTSSDAEMVGLLYQPNGNAWEDPTFLPGGEGAYAAVAADFDDDGDNDVVVSSYWTAKITYLENRTFMIPAFVSWFEADPAPGAVRLTWNGGNDTGHVDFRVLARRDAPDAPTRALAGIDLGADNWTATDRHADLLTGGAFVYTLESNDGAGWQPQATLTAYVAGRSAAAGLLEVLADGSRAAAKIRFVLPRAGDVALTIHDPRGRRLATLAAGAHDAGGHEYVWQGVDETGRRQASGVYLVSLRGESGLALNDKILLMR